MTKKDEQKRITKLLEDKNRLIMDNIRRAWKLKLEEVERSKQCVDYQYEALQTRLENIATSVQSKTALILSESKKLKEEIANMKKSISRAKAAQDLRESDESSEIEIELRLKMQTDELKKRLLDAQTKTLSLNEKMQYYKNMYLKLINKQRRIREGRDAAEELKISRKSLNDMLNDFKAKIANEYNNLESDIHTLREMKEELINTFNDEDESDEDDDDE